MNTHNPKEDGSLYANGSRLYIRPKRTSTGISMGGVIAECQNRETAEELAMRANEYEKMKKALKKAMRLLAWDDPSVTQEGAAEAREAVKE